MAGVHEPSVGSAEPVENSNAQNNSSPIERLIELDKESLHGCGVPP